jgi:hypothetical protein
MSKPSISFWIISVIALLWNLMGVNQYIQQAYNTDSFRAMYTAEQLELMDATPAWSTAAFAIAVFSATFGCLSLLLRKKWAYSLFLVSFIAIIIQNIDGFMRYKVSDFDLFALSMTIMVPLFALFLIWYSKKAITKNWIS